jgi:two-component system, OmpR family, phosphate regulon sensor histidine kinase PhoR
VRRLLGRRSAPAEPVRPEVAADAERGRILIEESRELVVVLDADRRVIAASRRARESLEGVDEGTPFPERLLVPEGGRSPLEVPYTVAGRRETLVYLGRPGDLAAYEELRAGFTAAVSHELRTPLARLLALLESAQLPGADVDDLLEQCRDEVKQVGELIDDVLFLSELEGGREVVSLGASRALPVLERVVQELAERAERAGMKLRVEAAASLEIPLRQRMLEVVAKNLAENAIRYAGAGTTCTLAAHRDGEEIVLSVRDDGAGVSKEDLPRLFERFYRGDRARASRGTGLGLAIVKHVVGAAGGSVEARRPPGGGLEIRCAFTVSSPTPRT